MIGWKGGQFVEETEETRAKYARTNINSNYENKHSINTINGDINGTPNSLGLLWYLIGPQFIS
jgi:hypothetical protein